jgi:hypothetical protein
MAIVLDSQRAFREVQRLSFCYLCGGELTPTDDRNREHVPPSSIFAVVDRNVPLILPTHRGCNSGWSQHDEAIGQLVGVLHGRHVPEATRLEFGAGHFADGSQGVAVRGLDLRSVIRRCVRGFHAALYREPLVDTKSFSTCPPMPEARVEQGDGQYAQVADVLGNFVEELKRNRATGTLDRIVCRNGKCHYDCVWSRADDGKWLCIYGFDLYGWKGLGDDQHYEPRGCIGTYRLREGRVPDRATEATELVFTVENLAKLDPFGD